MSNDANDALAKTVASALSLPIAGVAAVIALLGEGNTVPFVARYRKEATGGLDEVQIRDIAERHTYVTELEARRAVILESIREQGKLTDALAARIRACTSKTALEDLYLPFRRKRRTRASTARERGLTPLAERILAQPRHGDPLTEARPFVRPKREVPDVSAALAGARDIVAERIAEHADVRALVRETFQRHGRLTVKATPAARKEAGGTKYEQYYDYSERLARMPSHRFLAVRRGESEGWLRVKIEVDVDRLMSQLLRITPHRRHSPFAGELEEAAADGYKRLLVPSISTEVLKTHKQGADITAVDVFARNLRDLLLAAPLGTSAVLGIDPGLRTGCKCAALDATGRFLEHATIYPHTRKDEGAARTLLKLIERHRPSAIAVGNGTAGRETERFVRDTLKNAGRSEVVVVSVSESGASIYSASDIAREEFPDLDLTVRGAISIGRRLQDPLAELVKVEPRSIGVGQYQHDVDAGLLQRKLDEVVESCVNQVGVELNTASAPLLARVAGLGASQARKIVDHRNRHGSFASRREVLEVSGLGRKTFEQAAGFLRVRESASPLDASAVHPERYRLVERMARDLGVDLASLVGNNQHVERIDPGRYLGSDVGSLTLDDILAELRKPGRDPRAHFEPPSFRDDVRSIDDLEEGMRLEGVVTNVTAFGAFVDIGIKRDGLVHISELADHYVQNVGDVVRTGDRLSVRVLEVDRRRNRITLSAKQAS